MNISMFDVLGPIMIGPSSSHTAGAQRIGKAMYNMIADKQLKAVHFILHGSFHLTLRGQSFFGNFNVFRTDIPSFYFFQGNVG